MGSSARWVLVSLAPGSGCIQRGAVWSRMSYCSNQAPLQPVTPQATGGGLSRDLSCCEGLHCPFE